MTQAELNTFYSRVSFSGMLILYALKLSLEKTTAFDRDDLGKAVLAINSDYLLGFIVACTSFKIIGFNTKGKVVTITYVDPLISQTIEAKVKEMSQSNESWKKWYEAIPQFFK